MSKIRQQQKKKFCNDCGIIIKSGLRCHNCENTSNFKILENIFFFGICDKCNIESILISDLCPSCKTKNIEHLLNKNEYKHLIDNVNKIQTWQMLSKNNKLIKLPEIIIAIQSINNFAEFNNDLLNQIKSEKVFDLVNTHIM